MKKNTTKSTISGNETVIDLLKLDIEGDELSALLGVREDHWPLIRQVVVEVCDQLMTDIPTVLQSLCSGFISNFNDC